MSDQKEYFRRYYQANKAKYKEQSRVNYLKNREKAIERSRQWKEKNPERYQELTRNHSEKNREKMTARSAAWYRENKDRARQTTRKNKLQRYGLTVEQFSAMLASQSGKCPICQMELKSPKVPAVDHDHQTGAVRGILCRQCNAAIGQLQDNPTVLRRAAEYLENSSSSGVISTTNSELSTKP